MVSYGKLWVLANLTVFVAPYGGRVLGDHISVEYPRTMRIIPIKYVTVILLLLRYASQEDKSQG